MSTIEQDERETTVLALIMSDGMTSADDIAEAFNDEREREGLPGQKMSPDEVRRIARQRGLQVR